MRRTSKFQPGHDRGPLPALLALSLLLNVYFVAQGLRSEDADTGTVVDPSTEAPEEEEQQVEIRATPLTGHRVYVGHLRGSLAATLATDLAKHESDLLSAHLGRIWMWKMDLLSDPRPGDRFSSIYDYGDGVRDSKTDGPGDPIQILAAEYQSAKHGQTWRAYRFRSEGRRWASYWDAEGVEISSRLVHSPLEDYEEITSTLQDGRGHDGVDFKVPVGTPVQTPHDAVVVRRNWNVRANGYCVDLRYPETGLHGLFLHLSDVYGDKTQPGTQLSAGTVFARSGNTGRTTNPHLHYGLRRGKTRYLDPFESEKTAQRTLGKKDRSKLEDVVREMDAHFERAVTTRASGETRARG